MLQLVMRSVTSTSRRLPVFTAAKEVTSGVRRLIPQQDTKTGTKVVQGEEKCQSVFVHRIVIGVRPCCPASTRLLLGMSASGPGDR